MGKKIKRDPKSIAIAQAIMEQYNPKSQKDIEDALKEIFGPLFESVLQGELDAHLGYESNNHDFKETANRRNGYNDKTLKTTYGDLPIKVPRDRDASFEPQLIPKRKRDISGMENKILSMYARGMSQRDIATTIEDIYGFEISAETVSEITDRVMAEVDEWQNRPLKKLYTFLFVDCMYVSIRKDYETKNYAVYTILGYDINGVKDILGLWLNESESKHTWMQIFDEIKRKGVEDIIFISMDGVSGLEEGAKAIFKDVVVQRCIVHMIRNSIKYIPSKQYKEFTGDLRSIYGAPNVKIAEERFEHFQKKWEGYTGAVEVWKKNWNHVTQLFNYGSEIRRIMYTTNAIESVNSSFRKVTKRGTFPNEKALYKILYLRITELYKKWLGRPLPGWSVVRNQLAMNPEIQARILLYENL